MLGIFPANYLLSSFWLGIAITQRESEHYYWSVWLLIMQTFWYQHLLLILKKCSNIFLPCATNCYKHPLWRFIFTHFTEPYSGWLLLNVPQDLPQTQFLCQVLYIFPDPSNLTCISHASDYPFPTYLSIYWKPFFPPSIISLGHFLRTFKENSAVFFQGFPEMSANSLLASSG